MIPVRTSATPDVAQDSTETDQDSGSLSHEPFAYFDPESCSWKMCQRSLLEVSDESCTIWPKQGMWDRGFAYELPISALHISVNEFLSSPTPMLPTPSAYESTPNEEYLREVEANLDDPHKRLYLPGRKWHAQRTLSRMVPVLLPTPGANDSTGGEGQTRATRQQIGETGGSALRDINFLLPTPTAGDGKSSGSRNLPGSKAKPGVSLTDVVRTGGSTRPRSSAGNPSSDEPPPAQLTLADA